MKLTWDTREEESWDPGSNRVFCDVRQALRAGDMIVSYRGYGRPDEKGSEAVKQGGTADNERVFVPGRA